MTEEIKINVLFNQFITILEKLGMNYEDIRECLSYYQEHYDLECVFTTFPRAHKTQVTVYIFNRFDITLTDFDFKTLKRILKINQINHIYSIEQNENKLLPYRYYSFL